VSADKGLHGLFWPKQLKMAETANRRKRGLVLILKGFFERKTGAARQD
jgi:hypothetical protein